MQRRDMVVLMNNAVLAWVVGLSPGAMCNVIVSVRRTFVAANFRRGSRMRGDTTGIMRKLNPGTLSSLLDTGVLLVTVLDRFAAVEFRLLTAPIRPPTCGAFQFFIRQACPASQTVYHLALRLRARLRGRIGSFPARENLK